MGEGIVRQLGMDMDTPLYLTWRTSKDLLGSTGDSAQSSVRTLWSPERKDGGRDTQGAWDGHGHMAAFNMENQQGPAVQHRGLCSILCNNLMVPRERDGGRDSQGVWDGYGHTALSNMENQQGPAGQHRGFCSVSCGSLDGREVWRRMDPCLCMAEPLCCPPETITT